MTAMAQIGTLTSEIRLVRLLEYWEGKRAGREMPRRSDIDPIEIPAILPILYLTEVGHEPFRVRFRLVGTEVVRLTGRDVTGRHVDESLYGENAAEILGFFRAACEHRRPVLVQGHAYWLHQKEWMRVTSLHLPLGSEGAHVGMVLCGFAAEPHVRQAQPPLNENFDFRAYKIHVLGDGSGLG
ncbi:MAG: PAS domain-containing protein [Alphaproteobacteria bacterium]|nr:PAS domain-containing protein [Alphaproteobacteria bacterium]